MKSDEDTRFAPIRPASWAVDAPIMSPIPIESVAKTFCFRIL